MNAAYKDMIQSIYNDGSAEINGRAYVFNRMTHKQRRKIFAYYTHIAGELAQNDFSFLDSAEFAPVEAVIADVVSIDGALLSRISEDHWLRCPEDYVTFVMIALAVISHPLLPVGGTS